MDAVSKAEVVPGVAGNVKFKWLFTMDRATGFARR